MAGLSIAGALGAGLAERQGHRREDLDRIGWVPWPAVQISALFAAVLFVALALRTG